MVKVKICGITNARDALAAARLGADALGFNFWPDSLRYVKQDRARAIIQALPPLVTPVGVFVNERPETVLEICAWCGIRVAQFHGHETPRMLAKLRGIQRIKAIRVADADALRQCARYDVEALLLDAYVAGEPGGTGQTFNWELVREAQPQGHVILAGGLTPENVREAVLTARPFAVDVASGVEDKPRRKNPALMEEFISLAKMP